MIFPSKTLTVLLFTLLLFSLAIIDSAFAGSLTLDAAKSQGLVGEKQNGYLGAISATPSADVRQLIADINDKRRERYLSISKSNGTALAVVEKLAAQQAIAKTDAGNYVEVTPGKWNKK